MWQIFGFLFASVSTLFLLYASYNFGDSIRQGSQREYFAGEIASQWVAFGKALERYVHDYGGSLPSGDTTVTCTDLKNSGYLQLSFPCTDLLGRELRGLVAFVDTRTLVRVVGSQADASRYVVPITYRDGKFGAWRTFNWVLPTPIY